MYRGSVHGAYSSKSSSGAAQINTVLCSAEYIYLYDYAITLVALLVRYQCGHKGKATERKPVVSGTSESLSKLVDASLEKQRKSAVERKMVRSLRITNVSLRNTQTSILGTYIRVVFFVCI